QLAPVSQHLRTIGVGGRTNCDRQLSEGARPSRILGWIGKEDGRVAATDCLIALAGWSLDKKHAAHQDLVNALFELYRLPDTDLQSRIASAFTTNTGLATGRDPAEWCKTVRQERWDAVSPETRIAVLATLANDARGWSTHKDELLAALDRQAGHLNEI